MNKTHAREVRRRAHIAWRQIRCYDPHDARTCIVDMLTDLRHLCKAKRIDFADAIEASYWHYCEERDL